MAHVPSAGGSKLRSKRSSIRRTSEVDVKRIPFDKRFVTLRHVSEWQTREIECSHAHLTKADGIGLD